MKIKHSFLFSLLLAVFGFGISAHSWGEPNPKPKAVLKSEWLVEAAWLKDHLKDKDLIIVDTRSEKDYLQGHIPGAIWLDVSDVSAKTSTPGLQGLQEELAKKLSPLGITGTEQVIFYDEATGTRAPRSLLLLNYSGFSKGRVLHGGMAAWRKASFSLSWERTVRQSQPFVVKENPAVLASTDYVAKRIRNPGAILLDVRSREEYTGQDPSTHCARNGRIPGAVWLEWTELLDDTRKFMPLADLQKKLFDAGITPDKEIITYCHLGSRSSNTYLALRLLGFPRVKNYIGSWHEWAARLDLPIEKGESPASQ